MSNPHYDFCMFPTQLLSDPRYRALGGRDRDVLMAMIRWARMVDGHLTVCESYESIARMVAMDRRNVVRSVAKMAAAGLLTIVAEGSGVRPNTYVIDLSSKDPEAVRSARFLPAVVAPEQVAWQPPCDWMGSDWEPVSDADWHPLRDSEKPSGTSCQESAAEPSVITDDTASSVVTTDTASQPAQEARGVTADNTSQPDPSSSGVTGDYASNVTDDTPFRRDNNPTRDCYLSCKSYEEAGPSQPPGTPPKHRSAGRAKEDKGESYGLDVPEDMGDTTPRGEGRTGALLGTPYRL